MEKHTHEIAPDIFRFSTRIDDVTPDGFRFNQFLIRVGLELQKTSKLAIHPAA